MPTNPSDPSDALTEIERRFFDEWVEAEPEEATTLGLADPIGRLRDPSLASARALGASARRALDALEAIERRRAFDQDERLRVWAIRAHATERVIAADREAAETSLEDVPYAIAMLAHAAAHATSETDRAAIVRRIEALPGYVSAAREALAGGARKGRPFSTAVVRTVAEQLGSVRDDLAEIIATTFAPAAESAAEMGRANEAAASAADGILSFAAFLRDTVSVSPGAMDVVALGEAEYARRLRDWWGLDSIDDLRRRANRELEQARAMMIEAARDVAATTAAPAPVTTFADVRRVLDTVLEPRPKTADEIVPLYEREIERAVQFCRERRLFDIPEVCHCAVLRSPELWRRFSPCTNWPAPLLGSEAPGACAVLADPAVHPLANVPGLAVHEAVPGHFLQSRAWQLRFGRSRSPVRFLSVPDECGVLRGAWIPHFNIEGWAVFAEAVMEEAGFYDPIARLFHFYCRAIHAARALADMGLHTEAWSRERTAAFLAESTGMPSGSCASQAIRYARSGLQALGYMIGHLEIEAARERARAMRGAAYDELAFHAELLDAGPVPPGLLMRRAPGG